jgi:hypothetical protein
MEIAAGGGRVLWLAMVTGNTGAGGRFRLFKTVVTGLMSSFRPVQNSGGAACAQYHGCSGFCLQRCLNVAPAVYVALWRGETIVSVIFEA